MSAVATMPVLAEDAALVASPRGDLVVVLHRAGRRVLLTKSRADVLGAIVDSLTTRELPPTLREIGDAVGIASVNGVADHLDRLARDGLIERSGKGIARGLRVTPKGREALGVWRSVTVARSSA